jgi:hypothetical protein
VVEIAQLGGQVEHPGDLRLAQLKAHRVVVMLLFAVVARAGLVHIDRHVGRRAAGERLGEVEARDVGGAKRAAAAAPEQQQNTISSKGRLERRRLGARPSAYAACVAWQMATASASQASSDSIMESKPQQRLHHHLDLPFARLPIAHHAGLDFQRRIFAQFQPGLGDGQQGDPAHVRQFQSRADVGRIKHLLDGGGRGRMPPDHLAQPARDFMQARFERDPALVAMTPKAISRWPPPSDSMTP